MIVRTRKIRNKTKGAEIKLELENIKVTRPEAKVNTSKTKNAIIKPLFSSLILFQSHKMRVGL